MLRGEICIRGLSSKWRRYPAAQESRESPRRQALEVHRLSAWAAALHLRPAATAFAAHPRRALVAFRPPLHLCPRGRRMNPLPRLLETYEEARLLLEAKGW